MKLMCVWAENVLKYLRGHTLQNLWAFPTSSQGSPSGQQKPYALQSSYSWYPRTQK